jgi:hypothetical protein
VKGRSLSEPYAFSIQMDDMSVSEQKDGLETRRFPHNTRLESDGCYAFGIQMDEIIVKDARGVSIRAISAW